MTARLLLALATLATLAACGPRPEPSRADASKDAYCRQRADKVFALRNPNDQYRTDLYVSSQRANPYSGSIPTDPTADLQSRYVRDQILSDCLRGGTAQSAPP